jgi:hypothetical protein
MGACRVIGARAGFLSASGAGWTAAFATRWWTEPTEATYADGVMDAVSIHAAKTHFSRLVARALVERGPIVTADTRFDAYGVDVRW